MISDFIKASFKAKDSIITRMPFKKKDNGLIKKQIKDSGKTINDTRGTNNKL